MNVLQEYKKFGDGDKAALKALQAEESARLGREVGLKEIMEAVTPETVPEG